MVEAGGWRKLAGALGVLSSLAAAEPTAAQTKPPSGVEQIDRKTAEKILHDFNEAADKMWDGRYRVSEKYHEDFLDVPDNDPRKLEATRRLLKRLEEYESDPVPESQLKKAVDKIEELLSQIYSFRIELAQGEAGLLSDEDCIAQNAHYRKWAESMTKHISEFFNTNRPDTIEEAHEIALLKLERDSLTHYLEEQAKEGKK